MYYSLLEQFDGKEMRMRMASRKIDLLTYEMKAAGDNKEEMRKGMETFAQTALALGPQNIQSSLLALNYINLTSGHIYDDLILDMYEQLEKMFVPKPGIEVTMGNKNVAESGGMQLNGDTKQDLPAFLAMLNNLKQLGSGGK